MFGPEFSKTHFVQNSFVNLNQGSFGVTAKVALESQIAALSKTQEQPELYYRELIDSDSPRIDLRSEIAQVLNADPENVVCVSSASSAFNAVLRSIPLSKGDKLVYLSTIYTNNINTLRFLEKSIGVELVEMVVDYPRTDSFLEEFEKHLDGAKLAVFDTVSSMPSDYLPWHEMVQLCQKHNVLSFLDGAHGIGLVPIDLGATKPSFFTTNLHKWYHAPLGSAVLYVDSRFHNEVQGLPIGAMDPIAPKTNRLAKAFGYMSTMNYSALDGTAAAIQFHREFGDKNIMAYQNQLAEEACKLVCEELGVSELQGNGPRIAMFTVECPVQTTNPAFVAWARNRLYENYKTYVPMVLYRGRVYMRFSAGIHLDLDSFRYGIKALKATLAEWKE